MTSLGDAQDHADQLAGRLSSLSDRAEAHTTVQLRKALTVARTGLLALWLAEFGDIDEEPADPEAARGFVARAVQLLADALDPDLVDDAAAARAWLAAYALGTDHALDTAPALPLSMPTRDAAPDLGLSRAVAEQAVRALSELRTSAVAARGYAAVAGAMAQADRSATRVESAVAFETTRAAAEGVRDVAAVTSGHVLWVAERDGCLSCLAYAGQTATASGVFPSGLTFGDRPLDPPGPLVGPALHPRCRCSLEVWHPADVGVVEALRREAKRSVLQGIALDSEAARLQAADNLLAAGAGLPRTVEDRARAAVRRGEFN